MRLHRHQGALGVRAGVAADRGRDPQELVEPGQPVLDRFHGPSLHLRVQGGEDLQSGMMDHVASIALLQVLQHQIEKVIARGRRAPRRSEDERVPAGLCGFGRGNIADRRHARQHHLLAFPGAFEVAQRVVAGRRFRQTGQKGRLRQTELQGGLAEKNLRGLLDAVGAHPEGDLVDIGLQDFAFAVPRLDLQRHGQLAEFAQISALKRKEKVLGQLLRDGRGALDPAPAPQIDPEGLQDPQVVDTVVSPETMVLGGDDRLNEKARNAVQRHGLPSADDHDALAGGGVNFGRRGFDDPTQRVGHPGQVLNGDEEKNQHPRQPEAGRQQPGVENDPETRKPHRHCAE